MMNIFRISILLLSSYANCLNASTPLHCDAQPQALAAAIALPAQGRLEINDKGLVYLKVANDYIERVVPLIELQGSLKALPTTKRSLGAYIAVFEEHEKIIPTEIGQNFSFAVTAIASGKSRNSGGIKHTWALTVESAKLSDLRRHYLPAHQAPGQLRLILGHQLPVGPDGWQECQQWSPLNDEESPTLPMAVRGDFKDVDIPDALTLAAKINAIAQLQIKANGFVYLNVSNEYIEQLTPLLPINGEFRPLPTRPKMMGAHISVLHENEMIANGIWEPTEVGSWFNFEIKALRYIDRHTRQGKERLWILAVDSPALQCLRLRYGLNPKLQGHDFHITLGHEDGELKAVEAKEGALEIDLAA
jgi:hypothetical protein